MSNPSTTVRACRLVSKEPMPLREEIEHLLHALDQLALVHHNAGNEGCAMLMQATIDGVRLNLLRTVEVIERDVGQIFLESESGPPPRVQAASLSLNSSGLVCLARLKNGEVSHIETKRINGTAA